MSITISDPAVLAAFEGADRSIAVLNTEGKCIGYFVNDFDGKLPPGVTCPFTDEELDDIMRNDEESDITGSELLRQLQARG